MKKFMNKSSWIILILMNLCFSKPAPPNISEPRADGMINIRGILYTEEEIQNPERREEAELLAEKIQKLRDSNNDQKTYSGLPTDQILRVALGAMNNTDWDAAIKELSLRPEETKKSIMDLLEDNRKNPDELLFFARLPSAARSAGTEFEVEVAKKILGHPSAKKYDQILLFEGMLPLAKNGSLLGHLAESGQDETGTLDQLIADGRIERGSELEMKWRTILSGKAHHGRADDKHGQDQYRESVGSPDGTAITSNDDVWRKIFHPIAIACSLLLLGLAILTWRRVRV